MSIRVVRPGTLTSIQDLGRAGYQKFGISVGGAMDPFALRIANLLLGNEEGDAALEITMSGASLLFEEDATIALCGGDLSPQIDERPVPEWRPVRVRRGSTVQFGESRRGCRAYLSVAGGLDVPCVLGSRSTYLRAGIGGFGGRSLRAGDVLRFRGGTTRADAANRNWPRLPEGRPFVALPWSVSPDLLPEYGSRPLIRAMQGRQVAWFTEESCSQFFSAEFEVTASSDRMGYRLTGPRLTPVEPRELISEAVAAGTVQVPADGNPIILMADRATIGGYAKIAQVATVDLPVLAQTKPGDILRFKEISVEEAQNLYRLREDDIQRFKCGMRLRESTAC